MESSTRIKSTFLKDPAQVAQQEVFNLAAEVSKDLKAIWTKSAQVCQ